MLLFFSAIDDTILKLTSLPDPGAKPTVAVTGLPAGGCHAQAMAGTSNNAAIMRFILILWKKFALHWKCVNTYRKFQQIVNFLLSVKIIYQTWKIFNEYQNFCTD
jgi:hypothetical protein